MSSKRQVPRFRTVLEGGGPQARDPRFESLSGKFSEDAFRKRYRFIFDETLPAEARPLRKQLREEKTEEGRRQVRAALNRVESRLARERDLRRGEKVARGLRDREKEAVGKGKKPFYVKKSVRRQLELVEKYKELKSTGKLDKVLAKRRQHNAAKDHRYMPSTHRHTE